MERETEDKKFQSRCKLVATGNVERKESSLNPYNLPSSWSPCSKESDDNAIDAVNSLPELDCPAFPESHLDTSFTTIRNSSDNEPTYRVSPFQVLCCGSHWRRVLEYREIKARVEEAVKKHKIFLIRGEVPKLKEGLEQRGWIQKYESVKTRNLPYGSVASLDCQSLGDLVQPDDTLNERAVIFALLRHKSPDFIWDCRNDFVEWHQGLSKETILNRYEKPFLYTSKLGMAKILEDAHWFFEKDVSSVLFPRSYNLSKDPRSFVEDFRATAAAGLLKWVVYKMQNGDDLVIEENHVSIPLERLDFAIRRCEEYIAEADNTNIDRENTVEVPEEDWNTFLEDYNMVLHGGCGFNVINDKQEAELQRLLVRADSTLMKLKAVDSQCDLNGMRNIWILKPSNLCCGTGISISHDLKDIFRRVKSKPKNYFVVQKYIERPLLVQETKFDIRQWYLVTSTYPLTIWIFKEGLLRFSSKPYTCSTYHEAIHLCNTAIQERYDEERRRRRKRGIPEELVKSVRDQGWDCEKLNEYLKELGYEGEPYYERIYRKMGEAIVFTMLAAQEHMDRRRTSFELYGADFVVTEDLSIWLIEINTNPRMHPPSSKITKRLYSAVLESLLKVIMDLPLNSCADTGGFELLYKQNVPDFRAYLGPCLFVFGKSISLREFPRKQQKRVKPTAATTTATTVTTTSITTTNHLQLHRASTAPPSTGHRNPKIVDFIDYLHDGRPLHAR